MSASCDERREYQKHTPYLPDRLDIDSNRISGIDYHRFGLDSPEKYKPEPERDPDPACVAFKKRINILTMTEYLKACDEYTESGNLLSEHDKFNAFILMKADEKENEIMAKAKKTETLPANVDLQGLNESQIAIVTQKTPRYGDALKGAASDALKKCASLLGVALDLYINGHQYIDDPEPVKPKEPPKTESKTPDPEGITDKQKDLILKLVKSHVFTTEEKDKAISFCDNPNSTKEKAVKFIDSLQSHIKTRKESEEKEMLLKEVMKFRDADPANFGIAMADFKAAYNTESATTIEEFNHILAFRNNGNGNQQTATA